MKKILLNILIIVLSAPVIGCVAIVGGTFSVIYYLFFYVYAKLACFGEKFRYGKVV